VKPGEINFIEYTGVGRESVDDSILRGVGETLIDDSRSVPTAVSSMTAQMGHLTGAAGIVSLLRAGVELDDLSVLPSPGFDQPRQALAEQHRVLVAAEKSIVIHPANPEGRCFAGIYAGGANDVHYHVILKRGEKVVIDPNENRFKHFDATQRRKAKQRAKAEIHAAKLVSDMSEPIAPNYNGHGSGNGHVGASAPLEVEVQNGRLIQPVGPSAAELETFLVNFVVEQTGYPPEIVELDCDLEADLGIDSIKKAQLFGELREYFDIMPDERLTLDDFPTLRHVLDFLVKQSCT
jgi:acyl carrier protein